MKKTYLIILILILVIIALDSSFFVYVKNNKTVDVANNNTENEPYMLDGNGYEYEDTISFKGYTDNEWKNMIDQFYGNYNGIKLANITCNYDKDNNFTATLETEYDVCAEFVFDNETGYAIEKTTKITIDFINGKFANKIKNKDSVFFDNICLAIGYVTWQNEETFINKYFESEQVFNSITRFDFRDEIARQSQYDEKFVIIPKDDNVRISIYDCKVNEDGTLVKNNILSEGIAEPFMLMNDNAETTTPQYVIEFKVNEFEDELTLTNPGSFIPGSIEPILNPGYTSPFYRNQLLAEAMVMFKMIDTETTGIRRVFHIQREKFFPLPDYDITSKDRVEVSIYGKEINEKFTYLLHDNEDLNLMTVYLLDQVQKGKPISKEAVAHLRKHKLVEGRVNNLYLAAPLAKTAEDRAQYIKNKAFDNQYYQDMIVNYLREFEKANKAAIRDLLIDKLPDTLSSSQKERKVLTLLTALKRNGVITTDSDNKRISHWVLVNKDESV